MLSDGSAVTTSVGVTGNNKELFKPVLNVRHRPGTKINHPQRGRSFSSDTHISLTLYRALRGGR